MKKRFVWAILACGIFSGAATGEFVPGDLASVGLTRIVDDTTAGNIGGHYGRDALGDNWEPYVSVLGNSTFLFESNTYAESSPGVPNTYKMRFAVAFQPVAGGPFGEGEVFFGDDGTPYRGPINTSRQEGNPGRIAGDKRPGARYFMTGGEASPHYYPAVFGTMPPGPSYVAASRYGTVQLHSLNPTSLTQTMSSQAFDVLQGVLGTPADTTEVSRFGGELAALSNGNFLAVVDDKSNLVAGYRTPTAVIVKPDGTVVRSAFSIGPASYCTIWSNVAAYKGGFAVRCPQCAGGIIRFYDNDGNFQGQVAMNDPAFKDGLGNTLAFLTTDRGDKSRIAAHINSPYLFIAGHTTGGWYGSDDRAVVNVAVWDTRTRTYVAQANVTELIPEHGGIGNDTEDFAENWDPNTPRVALAVDALNRVCVSFGRGIAANQQEHVAARVLAFDPSTGAFTHLTHSFWVFINFCPDFGNCFGINTRNPSVAMTTRQICIAAKGEINLQNQPQDGRNSPYAVNLYTVISHPDPQDDPTCSAVFGDADRDGDVDLADFGAFQACFNGPNRAPHGGANCSCLDSDADTDVDLADFNAFQACFNGPNRPAKCP
ncbi:MAG: hypothetical protein ACPMAQ_01405 [Phycisphaerae bacterium]